MVRRKWQGDFNQSLGVKWQEGQEQGEKVGGNGSRDFDI